jgi:hypothetical protein
MFEMKLVIMVMVVILATIEPSRAGVGADKKHGSLSSQLIGELAVS